MSLQKSLDLKFGTQAENDLLKNIKDTFGSDIEKIENSYSLFDYTNDEIYIELKSRRVRHNQYPTTMVGYNKIKCCEKNPDKVYYFVFNFTDGVYYWKYKPNVFSISQGGRTDRGFREIKNYAFIPVSLLNKMCE